MTPKECVNEILAECDRLRASLIELNERINELTVQNKRLRTLIDLVLSAPFGTSPRAALERALMGEKIPGDHT